jgi:hypothetical protein
VQAKPGSGTIVDGSKVMHGAKIFKPQVKAPHLPKDKSSNLVYVGGDRWELQIDGQVRSLWCDVVCIVRKTPVLAFALAGESSGFRALSVVNITTLIRYTLLRSGPVAVAGRYEYTWGNSAFGVVLVGVQRSFPCCATPAVHSVGRQLLLTNASLHASSIAQAAHRYTTRDLRISMVYRARCMAHAEEAARYAALPETDMMSLDGILGTLKRGLVQRGATTTEKLAAMSQLDLAFLIVDTYMKYPLPPVELAWIPYNYCVLPKLLPWTAGLMSAFCK